LKLAYLVGKYLRPSFPFSLISGYCLHFLHSSLIFFQKFGKFRLLGSKFRTAKSIQKLYMFFRVKKRLMLMLSVKIHEAGRKFLKLPYRYRCAVDLADAFAVGMKYPSYDDGIILAMVDSHIVQYFFQLLVFNGKNGFHGGLLFSPSYHFPACSASEGKAK